MGKHTKRKTSVLLAQLGIVLLSLACSLTAVRPPTSGMMATYNTQPGQTTTISITTSATPTPAHCLVTSDGLNLRDGPGVQYTVKGYLISRTVLSPLPSQTGQGWIFVKVVQGGQTGYVNSKFTNCERK